MSSDGTLWSALADWQRRLRVVHRLERARAQKRQRRQMAVYVGDNKVLTNTFYGHKLYVDARDMSLAPHLIMDGFWETRNTRCYCRTLRRGMVVADVGANLGYYPLLGAMMIGRKGRLHIFEANPHLIDLLHQNMDVNGYIGRSVINHMAASDKRGTLRFNVFKRHHGSSSVVDFQKDHLDKYRDEVEAIEVPSISLDEYFEPLGMKVDILRMDAEGSEERILQGAKKVLAANPGITIFSEFAPALLTAAGSDPRRFLESLRDQGFRICSIRGRGVPRPADIDALCSSEMADLFLQRPR
jgi:FkbM family methyltransferase